MKNQFRFSKNSFRN